MAKKRKQPKMGLAQQAQMLQAMGAMSQQGGGQPPAQSDPTQGTPSGGPGYKKGGMVKSKGKKTPKGKPKWAGF